MDDIPPQPGRVYVAVAWPDGPLAAGLCPGRAVYGRGPDEASAIRALTAALRALK